MQVAVVLPAHQVLALELGLRERPRSAARNRRPRPSAARRVSSGGETSFRSLSVRVLAMVMSWLVLGLAAAGVVVEQRRRLGIVPVVVVAQVSQGGLPVAVGRLVLAHQQERLRPVALLEPVEARVGDDVGHVALMLDLAARRDHRRVVVDALARQDLPLVEAGRVADQVPFAEDGRLIARRLEAAWGRSSASRRSGCWCCCRSRWRGCTCR